MQGRRERPYQSGMGATEDAAARRPARPGATSDRSESASSRPVHVVVADPPAFTPWYDHELAAALARAGADVELATSRFRFGDLPPSEGYRRSERFYPLSSRVFRRSRLRLPLKAAEHLAVMRSLAR